MDTQTTLVTDPHWREYSDHESYQALIAESLAAEAADRCPTTWW